VPKTRPWQVNFETYVCYLAQLDAFKSSTLFLIVARISASSISRTMSANCDTTPAPHGDVYGALAVDFDSAEEHLTSSTPL
jgi:hypothetical protein